MRHELLGNSAARDRRRALAAERQRRFRLRRQTCILIAAELERFGFVEALIEVGRLGQWDEDNRPEIERAVNRLLADWQIAVTRYGGCPIQCASVDIDVAVCRETRSEEDMRGNITFPVALNVRVPTGIDRTVAQMAAREGRTTGEFVRGLVYAALKERGIEPNFAQQDKAA